MDQVRQTWICIKLGDDGPSRTIAYKLLFLSRLQDGNRAYKIFTGIMKPTTCTDINYGAGGGIYSNLLSADHPFKLTGTLGQWQAWVKW